MSSRSAQDSSISILAYWPMPCAQGMVEIPKERLDESHALEVIVTDLCGPFFYKPEACNKAPVKCYVSFYLLCNQGILATTNLVRQCNLLCWSKKQVAGTKTLVPQRWPHLSSVGFLPGKNPHKDLDVLTPADFLNGPPSSLIEPDVTNLNINRLESEEGRKII